MVTVPITAFYAGLLGVFYLYLSALVSQQRRGQKISLGDGGDKHFEQLIRSHANFSEYVPLLLVMLLVAELNQIHHLLLHGCGVGLLFARLFHAYGVRHHYGASWQRVVGGGLTYLILAVLAAVNLWVLY